MKVIIQTLIGVLFLSHSTVALSHNSALSFYTLGKNNDRFMLKVSLAQATIESAKDIVFDDKKNASLHSDPLINHLLASMSLSQKGQRFELSFVRQQSDGHSTLLWFELSPKLNTSIPLHVVVKAFHTLNNHHNIFKVINQKSKKQAILSKSNNFSSEITFD